ncbi:MAG: hypothetical protein DWQ34_22610 [Planctomycetota bacterium]|nr:MAG: hypothetical protein DWQ34_22610 [Planctomycetota bacterium]
MIHPDGTAETDRAERRPSVSRAVTVAAAAVLFAVLYAPVLFAPAGHISADPSGGLATGWLPAAQIAANLAVSGEFPIWDPYSLCGAPFLRSARLGILYPPHWLHMLLPPERTFNFLLVAHALLAAGGTWMYCRGRGRSLEASLFAAMAFSVGGCALLYQFAGQPYVGYSAAWLPCIFWSVDRLRKQPGWARCCILTLLLACQILAGALSLSVFLGLMIPLYVILVRPPETPGGEATHQSILPCLLGAAVMAVGLAGAQLGPTFASTEDRHEADVSVGGSEAPAGFPPINVTTLIAPGLFGDAVELEYWGQSTFSYATAFCGLSTLLLAVAGVLCCRPDRETSFWILTTLAALFVSMSESILFHLPAASSFPVLGSLRGTGVFSVFLTLALSILSARGIDACLQSRPGKKGLRKLVAVAGLGFGAVVIGWALLEQAFDAPPPAYWRSFVAWVRSSDELTSLRAPGRLTNQFVEQSYHTMVGELIWAASVLCVVCSAFLIGIRRCQPARSLLIGVLFAELYLFASPYLKTYDATPLREPSRLVRAEIPPDGRWRFCCVTNSEQLVGQFAGEDIESPGGVGITCPTRYSDLIQMTIGVDPRSQESLSFPVVHEPLFDLLNVRYYAASRNANRIGDSSRDRLVKERVFVWEGVAFDLFENVDVLPRAFIVHQARSIQYSEGGKVLLPRLLEQGVHEASFVEGPLPFSLEPVSGSERTQEQCLIAESSATRMVVDVELTRPGLVVVSGNYDPGWRASIDGAPAEVAPANLVMRAVAVPAGRHTVEFQYSPAAFRIGRSISLVALVVAAGSLIWTACRTWLIPPREAKQASANEPIRPASAEVRAQPLLHWQVGFFLGAMVFVFAGGGWVYQWVGEYPPPPGVRPASLVPIAVLTVVSGVVAALSAWRLWGVDRKRFGFGFVAFLLLFPSSLLLLEAFARLLSPSWPVIALHGVSPEVAEQTWSRVSQADDSVGLNDWGQRDRDRSLKPDPGMYRIAFIGDSFLEEATTVPVSLLVEERLGRDDVEVVNLGVSATSPDEYFYRLRNVALPLGADYCMMFVFTGNDFSEPGPSLPSYAGVAAVNPRGSLLTSIGLTGVNHLLTNQQRPVIQAWLGAGNLRRSEEYRFLVLSELETPAIRQLLLSAADLPPGETARLKAKLESPDMEAFYEMLREPDEGQFRSYYLASALRAAGDTGAARWEFQSEDAAMHWVREAARVCESNGVAFTLVIIPEAFQVDSRMVEQWKPLADMRRVTQPCRDAGERLASRARSQGIDVVDLYPALHDVPGSYLNLDGHWSDKGVDIVSEVLTDHLQRRLHPQSQQQ